MNRCVCCGEIIPEGRQVCPNCENHIADVRKKVELKPCPFCGGEAVVIDNGCFVDVSCKNFHCRGWADSLMYKTKEEAIEAWNRRATDG